MKQAKGVQLQNLQAYRKAVLSAFADVEKALIALQKFPVQERLQQDVVNASQQAFDVAEKQLKNKFQIISFFGFTSKFPCNGKPCRANWWKRMQIAIMQKH